jgi:hypothetical protein
MIFRIGGNYREEFMTLPRKRLTVLTLSSVPSYSLTILFLWNFRGSVPPTNS